jgi:hypothetical protein
MCVFKEEQKSGRGKRLLRETEDEIQSEAIVGV